MADFERAVLACMLIDAECCERGLASLTSGDFAEPRNSKLFESIRRCAQNMVVDVLTVAPFADDGGAHAVFITQEFFSKSQFPAYLEGLHEQNRRRRTLAACQKAIAAIKGNDEDWKALAHDVALQAQAGGGSVEYVGGKALDAFNTLYSDRKAAIRTGFPVLDSFTKGLCPGELLVLAARTSLGKTSFAMNIAVNAALAGHVTAVFSLETSATALLRRCIYALSGKSERLLLCENNEAMFSAVEAATKLAELPLCIFDRASVTAEDIASQCYKVKHTKGKLELVVIDYLGLINSNSGRNTTRERVVAEISRRIKTMALDLNVPVILLCQLSRNIENRTESTPRLSDLRESGAIEQDADVVLFISPTEDEATDKRTITIAKNRNGRTGSFNVDWRGEIFKFSPEQRAE